MCREQEMLYVMLSILRLEARNISTLQCLIGLETLLKMSSLWNQIDKMP